MGSSYWSDDYYKDRVDHRKATATPTFVHDAAVRSGTAKTALHDKLNPKGVLRESRDSAEHPDSVAIAVLFDVTGSMGDIPRQMQKKLPGLMGLLLRKGYVKDPHILFGAIGDYHSDQVALQVGQFESGIEMDDDLTRIYIEGNGGGQTRESYQDIFYFAAKHTSIDCWEKRGHKGYLFITGDENAYMSSSKKEIADVFGDSIESPEISTRELVAMAQEKYHIFYLIPTRASNGRDPAIKGFWVDLIGAENVIMLDDPDTVCEAIGLAIGLVEGTATMDSAAADLKTTGASAAAVATVTSALDPLARSTALARVGSGSALPVKTGRSSSVERL
jgi:hypothetical protein